MQYRFLIILLVLFTSCGLQKRLSQTAQLVQTTKQQASKEKDKLEETGQIVDGKLSNGEIDSLISQDYDQVLTKLNAHLDSLQKRIGALESFMSAKSNFRGKLYLKNVAPHLSALDSFNLLKEKREIVYQLVKEAIGLKAFKLFNMAAFFEPGVYNIPPSAFSKIRQMFTPALDSLTSFSNKYSEMPKTARLVFVGYADESPIAEGGALYNDLSRLAGEQPASRQELNRVLSQLRASEMMQNLKILVPEKMANFISPQKLKFSYFNYGRGEAHPSTQITDYKPDDERRRIVMFYWAVLPELSYLK